MAKHNSIKFSTNRSPKKTRQKKRAVVGGSSTKRLENWRKQFSGILGQPPTVPVFSNPIRNIHPLLNIEDGPFTIDEQRLGIKQIGEGKAYGQWRNVACWRPPAEKCSPLSAPFPFWWPSLKLNKFGDFREYAGKISKKVCF